MTRVLFVLLPELGHIHPFLGAAEALRERGARVDFYAPRDVSAILRPRGWTETYAPAGALPPAAEHRGAAFAELVEDPSRLRTWIRAMLVDAAAVEIAPLREHLARVRPDVVVIDPMAYFGAIAAELEGLPWLGLSTSLNPCIGDEVESELVATLRALDPLRHALFRAHGMHDVRFRVSDVLSPRGTFVLSTPALVGEGRPADDRPLHLVGSALPRQAAAVASRQARGHALPLVYASFGSQAYHQPTRVRALFAAARAVEARFVIAMGDLASSALARAAPPNVEPVAFAPQLALLGEAGVAITHGGANSVQEALALGVPLLASPICNDQHHNATLVAARGAGRVLDLASAEPAVIAAAVRALLAANAPERAAAEVIARSYATAGGASRIADVILRSA